MVSDMLWLLAVLGAVFWIVLPATVLVMAVFYKGKEPLDPEAGDASEDEAALG